MDKKGRRLLRDLLRRGGDSLNEEEKKLVYNLLDEKVCDLKEELDWAEHRRDNHPAEELKRLVHEHEEQRLDVIMAWREVGEAAALAANLVVRAQAAMDRQGWWFRFEEHKCDEGEDKVAQVKKGLNLAERGIDAMVEGLKAVEFPDTFVDLDEIDRSTLPPKKKGE